MRQRGDGEHAEIPRRVARVTVVMVGRCHAFIQLIHESCTEIAEVRTKDVHFIGKFA